MGGYYVVQVWTKAQPEPVTYLSRTVWEARKQYAEERGCDVTDVMGRRIGF
jgi:hypothetical protein